MALKQVILNHKIAEKRKALQALIDKATEQATRRAALSTREAELETAVNEITDETPEEDRQAVQAAVDEFDQQTEALNAEAAQTETEIAATRSEIEGMEAELNAMNARAMTPGTNPGETAHTTERSDNIMITRDFFGMTPERRDAFFARNDVRDFAEHMRGMIGQKRAINNDIVIIPTVMLPMIQETVAQNSKLLKYVNLQNVKGKARQVIMGTIPEAVWTEMYGKLNEIDLTFNDTEVDGYKVGAYIGIYNALKEDNDVELVAQIIRALGVAEAIAVDKAILYGTGTKMPLGILTRLAQTTAPADLPETARPWVDLHTTNIITITAANSTGVKLFQSIVNAFGAAKKKYNAGGKFWAMNEKTHMKLISEAMSINAAGAVVSGMNDTMPVIGGPIEELDFIPDDVIIPGYGMNYLMVERAGREIAQSEHVRFIEDQTVFKGTARYDGQPVIPESFVAIGINGATPSAAAVTFTADTANAAPAAGGEG